MELQFPDEDLGFNLHFTDILPDKFSATVHLVALGESEFYRPRRGGAPGVLP